MPQKKKKRPGGNAQIKPVCDKNDAKSIDRSFSKPIKNINCYFTQDETLELETIFKKNNVTKMPPLVLASVLEKNNLIEELIKQGENPNETDDNNNNALVWSIKTKKLLSISTLLSNGADPFILSDDKEDHILTMALETKIWDEQSLITLWKNVRNMSEININFINKNGHSMLHMAVRREWLEFIKILINEKANVDIINAVGITPLMLACYRNNYQIVKILLDHNADILKKDDKGSTPLCYAISASFTKKTVQPQVIQDILIKNLKEKNGGIDDYVLIKVNQFLELKCKILPSFVMATHIMSFTINKLEEGIRILLECNIIKKIQEALIQNIANPENLKYNLMILHELFKFLDSSDDARVENEIMTNFVAVGCIDTCFKILKKYEKHETYQWISIVCLQCIIANCQTVKLAELWLERNYHKFYHTYTKYLENNLLDQVSSKDLKDYYFEVNTEKLKQFQKIMLLLQNGEKVYDDESDSIINGEDLFPEQSEENTGLSPECKNADLKYNSKRSKRRTKALKAKMAKIKSADLVERLNITSKKSSETKKSECFESVSNTDEQLLGSSNTGESSKSFYYSYMTHSLIPEQSDIVESIKNMVLSKFDNDPDINWGINNDFPEQQDWKSVIQNIKFEYTCYPEFKPLTDKIEHIQAYNSFYSVEKEIESRLNRILKYLCDIFHLIIERYKKHWQIDREFENELHYRKDKEEKNEYVIHILQNLEREKVQYLQTEFGHLLSHIKALSTKNLSECDGVLRKVEYTLMTHKIRGKSILHEVTPYKEVQMDIKYADSFLNSENFVLAKYIEDVLNNKTEPTNEVQIKVLDPVANNESNNLSLPTDDLYIKEMSTLKKNEQSDPQKQFQAKYKTMKNSYHLVPSIMSVIESDSEESNLSTENEKCERIYTKSRTFFNKSAKFLESHQNAQFDTYSNKFLNHLRHCDPQNGCSRWSYLLHSLEANKDSQHYLGGTVRISPQTKRHTHVISTGGNFTPVELGLDNYNRPLAVKRIPSGSCVCKLIKQLVTPLLGLRNTHILHYCACDFDNNELIIATPLCEYNMGQYVMLMKQNNKLTLNATDIVRQLLTGLMFLHNQKEAIVHGNLKPSNIFIDSNDVVRVAEFGTHKALFKLKEAPNSSVIWFSTETFKTFKQYSKMECTCASDIQVTGMLIHFILTAGKHVYGDDTRDILKNLEKAMPKFSTTDLELQDLLTWMLMFYPNDRPTVQQVFSHVYFWSIERKWKFVLACAGLSIHGTDIPLNLNDFYYHMDKTSNKDNIKGKWTQVVKSQFPNATTKIEQNDDTPSGLLKYIRSCIKTLPSEEFHTDLECCNFFINSFPAFTLSLYRIIDNTEWMEHPAFINFYTLHT